MNRARVLAVLMVGAVVTGCASAELSDDGDGGAPDATAPADAAVPDAAVAVDAAPDAAVADASPADAAPADAAPADASPADARPADAAPADASPADASPADARPADASPADASPPDASPPDASPPPDAAPILQSWRVDTAAEFAAENPFTVLTAVDPRGALEPFAYYTGGLVVRASDTGVIASATTTTWAQVIAFPATAKSGILRSTDQYWGDATPQGLGLTDGDNWTVWAEGEIFLEAGLWTFTLEPDDRSFVEIADAAGAFTRVVATQWPNTATGTVAVTAGGWFGFRWANSDIGGGAGMKLRYQGPSVPTAAFIPRDKLRSRVDQLTGLAQIGFDDAILLGANVGTIDRTDLANVNWGVGRPLDLGISEADTFSCRWSGQIRIDTAGNYVFRYQSDDGQRLFIDGTNRVSSDFWLGGPRDVQTGSIRLEPGWHDIVVDHSDSTNNAAAWLQVLSGPELMGQPLPLARLRPVEARSERFEAAVNATDIAIPDLSTITSTINLTAPSGAVGTLAEVRYQFRHTAPADLVITLVAPSDGEEVSVVLRDRSTTPTIGRAVVTLSGPIPVAGAWTLRVQDTRGIDSGTLEDFAITVHYAGAGQPPIAPIAIYQSPVRDLGNVASIDRVTWEQRKPTGTSVFVKMRTCAAIADCATAPWSAPMTEPTGSIPVVSVQRFAQYRVELVSNGDASSSLEWIQIDYRSAP